MALLPYPPRPGQEALVTAIEEAQGAGSHLVAEAGTGMGKTTCALTACSATTRMDGRRTLYITRTNSQQAQVVREHALLKAAGADPGLLVPFMGRKQYCPLLRSDLRFAEGTPEELGKLCRDAKEKAVRQRDSGKAVPGACPFYLRLLQDGTGPIEALLDQGGLDGGELGRRVEQAGSCPYEALKMLLPKARTVVAPLIFVIDHRLRSTFLQWMGVGADECHLVVDEAHHLPEAARDHHSPRLTMASILRAQKEAQEFADPMLAGVLRTSSLLDALVKALHAVVDEFVRNGSGADGEPPDGLVPPGALEESLLSALRLPSPTVLRALDELDQWGEVIREDRRKKGRLPRSYLAAVSGFLRSWIGEHDAPYVHLATAGDNPGLQLFLVDPAAMLTWLEDFWSTLHMSGTLAPLPEHQRLTGLAEGRTRLLLLPSPFDAANLRTIGIEGIHRRWAAIQEDPTIVERQQEAARTALAQMPGRTALFFPSYSMMEAYLEEGFLHGIERPRFVEESGMSSAELTRLADRFRKEKRPGALLLGVLGGRLSEGLDFPGEEMEHMLVFGVPYPRPSARQQALIHYFDAKAGNGWSVAVHTPVGRVLRQAIGRLIRSPDDRGTAVVLDERVVRFRDHLAGLVMAPSAAGLASLQTPLQEAGYRTADSLRRPTPETG